MLKYSILLSATAALTLCTEDLSITSPPSHLTSYFDTTLHRRVLRFLVGGDGDLTSSTSLNAQCPQLGEGEIEGRYMVIAATSGGGVYTFSPRNIDMTWNIFDDF